MAECLGVDGDFGNPASATHRSAPRGGAGRARARAGGRAPRAQTATRSSSPPAPPSPTTSRCSAVARANADRGRHVVTSRTEHKSVLDPCRQLEKRRLQRDLSDAGRATERIGPGGARARRCAAIRCWCLSCTPTTRPACMQDVAAHRGRVPRARRAVAQRLRRRRPARWRSTCMRCRSTLLSFTAHKLYGPKGVGALYVRRGARALLQPLSFGGGQERGLRPGTLPTHQIVGLGAGLRAGRCNALAEESRSASPRCASGCGAAWRALRRGASERRGRGARAGDPQCVVRGRGGREPGRRPGRPRVSTGSACSSASADPSYVLRALGRDTQLAQSSLRFSFGRFTTAAEVDLALASRSPRSSRRGSSPAGGSRPALGRCPAPGRCQRLRRGGGPGQDTWVRFDLLVADDIVKDARFQVVSAAPIL